MRCLRTDVLSFDVFSLCSVQEPPSTSSEAGSGSPCSEAGSNASTVMRHRDIQIDLTSDFQAAIDVNGQFKFSVDVDCFESPRSSGAYPRKQTPITPKTMTGYELGDGKQVSHERVDFRKAICDGDDFSIEIRGVSMSWLYRGASFGDPPFAADEDEFLSVLVNVLHFLSSSHGIGYDYPAIARNGIECMGNSVQDGRYFVSAIFPIHDGSLTYGCVCELKEVRAFDQIFTVTVTSTVNGQLPPRPAPKQFQLTGNVSERSGLQDIGYLSFMLSLQELLYRPEHRNLNSAGEPQPCCESNAKFRTVANSDVHSLKEGDKSRALAEVTKQICSMCNIAVCEPSITSRNNGNNTTEVNLRLGEGNTDLLSVTLTSDRLELYKIHSGTRAKQAPRARTRPRLPYGEIVNDHILTVSCSPGGLRHLRQPEDASGRIAYLQKHLKTRDIVCTETTARDLLHMCCPDGPDLGPVQLILRDDTWSHQVAFVQQNKNPLMDMIQDLWQTAHLLSNARLPPDFEMTQDSTEMHAWPHTPAGGELVFRCEKSPFCCRINLDSAGYIVMNLARSLQEPFAGRPLGGIRLAQRLHRRADTGNAVGDRDDAGDASGDESAGDDVDEGGDSQDSQEEDVGEGEDGGEDEDDEGLDGDQNGDGEGADGDQDGDDEGPDGDQNGDGEGAGCDENENLDDSEGEGKVQVCWTTFIHLHSFGHVLMLLTG